MTILNRQIDEGIVIGERLRITPTDIDSAGARIRVRGELIGGADDGLTIDRTYELAVGSSVRLGTLVNITLMKSMIDVPRRAQFGIQVPPNLVVQRKESTDNAAREEE
jgi:sRNA-binding carbon storage regulator CsrA